ncbi:secondary thiamine-phosphate synthase enzyme YjbQ [Zooshikella harenae]|uniref:Secondary thiamine-phosphate synthase enzyme YjbQ n=1 Tax=Zooshikella harenae TaxID=2827238 RepID=A0ABS5ZC71_9GAMM|nr:secondary thiamine-phosphate synthase enzyme YjbQ [Zooshikella harenae]MBU2711620.1 secondary thiamine-phosphate synthase enzyme YjbQ [Zooshikella harenae]
MWAQKTIKLRSRPRGFHLVTDEVLQQLPELSHLKIGLLHLFIKHTSASLALNENADPTVREDLEVFLNEQVPEDAPYFQHIYEGPDDMPAHIKSIMIGTSLSLPVSEGRLQLGTWQGIYLGEHREKGGSRLLVATIQGEYF